MLLAESVLELLLTELCKVSRPASGEETSLDGLASLELHGYEVGYRYLERSLQTRSVHGGDHLEVMKFICKEFWHDLFGKHVDKLQTNHRGVFVLRETSFKWARKVSSHNEELQRVALLKLLQFPCGLLRGALASLGVDASVSAELGTAPSCNFNVRIINKSPVT